VFLIVKGDSKDDKFNRNRPRMNALIKLISKPRQKPKIKNITYVYVDEVDNTTTTLSKNNTSDWINPIALNTKKDHKAEWIRISDAPYVPKKKR